MTQATYDGGIAFHLAAGCLPLGCRLPSTWLLVAVHLAAGCLPLGCWLLMLTIHFSLMANCFCRWEGGVILLSSDLIIPLRISLIPRVIILILWRISSRSACNCSAMHGALWCAATAARSAPAALCRHCCWLLFVCCTQSSSCEDI